MIKPRYIIGFTGHRSGCDETVVGSALRRVLGCLKAQAEMVGGETVLYSSVAEGADTTCVEIARELGMPVHLLLPLREVEFSEDFSTSAAWMRSATQISKAREMPGQDSVRLVSGESKRPECYYNQGIQMLDAADVLVSVWDGEVAQGIGGTQQVVAHARAIGLPVINIAPTTGETQRWGDIGSTFKPDKVSQELSSLAGAEGKTTSEPPSSPHDLQACLDRLAVKEAARFRPSRLGTIVLQGLAALLGAVATFKMKGEHPWNDSKWIITLIEFVLVGVALSMTVRLRKLHTRKHWVNCRFACELVRGLRGSIPILDPLHPFVARHDPEWRRFALSAGLFVLAHQKPAEPMARRDNYVATRLSDTHAEGQIRHYQTMRPSAMWWWNFTGFIGIWSARLAPLFVGLSLMNKFSRHLPGNRAWRLDENASTWLLVVFFPIALPLLAGIAAGIRHTLDAGRRKHRYPEMVARLTELRTRLAELKTESSIQTFVARSENLLFDELVEWKLAMTNTRMH